ncbi:glutathione S-transferase family protein [Salinicola sp. MIT1003]|uniref:glutathione S-transferase family protein n=1 Tax=Salinicola sp. MIT1003 TaxID=1882734 RepID=UPI0008DE57B1|nr:glutathione S-transferase family protein [Salinicola sp. MIT1003]OHZ02707.1 hypothetical protein BC443_13365 [Salinicola sp. MIT1003]
MINSTSVLDDAVLVTTLTSPYGKKVRMVASELSLMDNLTIRPADTRDADDPLRDYNPLGKMPCLLLNHGEPVFDSNVIIGYLLEHSGDVSGRLYPEESNWRWQTRRALADGVIDAALLMVYEARFREAEQVSTVWLNHQHGKIERALEWFQANPPGLTPDLPNISLACALGYLDWRQPLNWRATCPALIAWLSAFCNESPALGRILYPEE